MAEDRSPAPPRTAAGSAAEVRRADVPRADVPRVDGSRLAASLRALAAIGSCRDEATGLDAVRRVALTDADGAGRRHVVQRMEELGLAVTIDAIGNVYGRRAGRDDDLAPVVLGSHIDSVPTAGAFDGTLGVLGALEVVATLDEHRLVTRRPLVAAFFTDEEGCRFGTDMLGSAVATGRIPLEEAYELADADGRSVRDELVRLGFLGEAPVDAVRPHAYLECHIEQGPVLARAGRRIGVVTGVQGISWHEVTFTGRAAHAGTTPMELRADAGLAAARLAVHLADMVDSGRFGALRATVGRVRHEPGAVNVVAGRAVATVDLRHPDDARMAEAEEEVFRVLRALQDGSEVTVSWRRTAGTPAVAFDARVRDLIAASAGDLGLSHMDILSGAGHDAQEWAHLAPAGMVFVPGEHDGISHNPRELSTEQACADGVDVLLRAAVALADEG